MVLLGIGIIARLTTSEIAPMMVEFKDGDRVRHSEYGLGTVEQNVPPPPKNVFVRWDIHRAKSNKDWTAVSPKSIELVEVAPPDTLDDPVEMPCVRDSIAQALSRPELSAQHPSPPFQISDDDAFAITQIYQRLRRGQYKFRRALLEIYSGACLVTGTKHPEVLEAAHILSHAETGINDPKTNGLLFRSDIHILFDAKLLRIEPTFLTVRLHESLKDSSYWIYEGQDLSVLQDILLPAIKNLRLHSESCDW